MVLALDELANIAPLPELPSMVSEGGGQGLVTLACFQDLSQARHRWPGQADGFPSLFGTTVVLPGIGDVRTLEALSVLTGDHEVVVRSVSRGRALSDRPLPTCSAPDAPRSANSSAPSGAGAWLPTTSPGVAPDHALAFGARNQPGWFPLAPGPPGRAVALDAPRP